MWCVIPAAGGGTRLAAVSDGKPKALLEIGGTTLIHRLLVQVGPRVDRACIVVPAGDDRIPERVGKSVGSLPVSYVRQAERLGVGHAVLQARSLVRGPFLVVMGDAFYSEPLGKFVEGWLASDADGAILVERHSEPDQPMGRVRIEDGRVAAIEKVGATAGFTHTLAGCLVLPDMAFSALAEAPPAASGEVELETAVSRLLDEGYDFAALRYRSWRTNVNRPDDIQAVRLRLASEAAQSLPSGSGAIEAERVVETK